MEVTQRGVPSCSSSVTPGAIATTASGESGVVTVTPNDSNCSWTATSDKPWVKFGEVAGVGPYAQAVLDDHPMGYWRLNDASGATAAVDTSGFGHIGTLSGGVTLGQPGPLGDGSTSTNFDGATASVDIPDDARFNLTALSWEAWVNVPTISTEWRTIFAKGADLEMCSLTLGPNMTQPTVSWSVAGAGRQRVTLSTALVGAGWVHLAFTYDGATWRVYANGMEEQAGTLVDTLLPNTSPLVFGRDDTAARDWYNGELAEAALYPYALAAEQIANHVAQRAGVGMGTGQVVYAIAPNVTGLTRMGTLAVADQTVSVSEAATGQVAIAGHGSPSPNGLGWNNTDVVISFVCAGLGILTCPGPVSVRVQLSGQQLFYSDHGLRKPENGHHWAIVDNDLRNGVDTTYDNYFTVAGIGIILTSAYRSPIANAVVSHNRRDSRNSWHMLGRAADMKPADSGSGDLLEAVWNDLANAAQAAGPRDKVKIEDRLPNSKDHVHATFLP